MVAALPAFQPQHELKLRVVVALPSSNMSTMATCCCGFFQSADAWIFLTT